MQEKKSDSVWVRIGGELPALEEITQFVQRDHCGAINVFQGVTRNHDEGRRVKNLYYDSYPEMALKESFTILKEVSGKYPVGSSAILHKTGEVPVGRVSMIVAVSTPHRRESAEAVLEIIHRLKKYVPIWKKEFFEDDEAGIWKEESRK